jgi:UDP-N-acetylmuramyl pentapeptide phosphotransferase/UDP-N-acetylglucosamine-1-phosphate transferase
VIVLVSAFVVLALSWWLTRRLSSPQSVLRLLDEPNERSLHSVPTPRTGGLAMVVSLVAGFGVAAGLAVADPAVLGPARPTWRTLWVVAAIALVCVVSFLDDRITLPVSRRFALQGVAVLMLVYGGDLAVSAVPIPAIGTLPLAWLSGPVSLLFLLWMANLYNFMDGMDGFAGGMTVIGFGFLAVFGWAADHAALLLIGTLTAVSALGFLPHNFPPARIFMGDVGSVTLGLLAGTLTLVGIRDGVFDAWVPALVFAPFIVDATVTVLRRALQGATIWQAHRTHYYQRLVLHGWGHRRTVLAEYGLMLLCGSAAILYQHARGPGRLVVLAASTALFAGLALGVHLIERRTGTGAQTTSSARETVSPNRPIA